MPQARCEPARPSTRSPMLCGDWAFHALRVLRHAQVPLHQIVRFLRFCARMAR